MPLNFLIGIMMITKQTCVIWLAYVMLAINRYVTGMEVDFTGKYHVVDMSYVFDNTTLYFDGETYFNKSVYAEWDTPEFWALTYQFHTIEHGGTHMDAPSHFVKGKHTIDEIPVSQFIGPAVIIDAVDKAEKNNDYEVTVDDLSECENANGRIPEKAVILLNFNWETRWPDHNKVFAFDKAGMHHPGLHGDAAKWLVANRPDIHGVGTDCPSLDYVRTIYGNATTEWFPAHKSILGQNLFILENVRRLNDIPNLATIYAFPMNIGGGTGGPTRVVALFNHAKNVHNGDREKPGPAVNLKKQTHVVDMSYVYDETTLYFDGGRYFNKSVFMEWDTPEFWALTYQFHTIEHGGTHIDAPSHFLKGKRTVDEIPVSQLIGPAVIIDAVENAKKNYDYEVTIDDLMEWEKLHGRIPKGAVVLLNFNWSVRWPDPDKVFFKDAAGMHHPGLHGDAAKWLVANRPDIHGVGTDCPSLDYVRTIYGNATTEWFPAHKAILGHNLFILENVRRLNDIPNLATIYAFPMKIRGGTGGPTRVVALFNSSRNTKYGSVIILAVFVVSQLFTCT